MAASTPLGLTDWLSFAASFVLVLLLIGFLFFLLRRLGGGRLRAGNDKHFKGFFYLAYYSNHLFTNARNTFEEMFYIRS